MADEQSSIFNKKAAEKLRSPDDLEKYVRVTNPGVWVILGACIALLLGLLAWGFFGDASTSVSINGTVMNDKVVCFVSPEDATSIHEGDAGFVDGKSLSVVAVSDVPLSSVEAYDMLDGDYIVFTLVGDAEWAYAVWLGGDAVSELTPGIPLEGNITTGRVAPISLLVGRAQPIGTAAGELR